MPSVPAANLQSVKSSLAHVVSGIGIRRRNSSANAHPNTPGSPSSHNDNPSGRGGHQRQQKKEKNAFVPPPPAKPRLDARTRSADEVSLPRHLQDLVGDATGSQYETAPGLGAPTRSAPEADITPAAAASVAAAHAPAAAAAAQVSPGSPNAYAPPAQGLAQPAVQPAALRPVQAPRGPLQPQQPQPPFRPLQHPSQPVAQPQGAVPAVRPAVQAQHAAPRPQAPPLVNMHGHSPVAPMQTTEPGYRPPVLLPQSQAQQATAHRPQGQNAAQNGDWTTTRSSRAVTRPSATDIPTIVPVRP